jgi:hypothetical protein
MRAAAKRRSQAELRCGVGPRRGVYGELAGRLTEERRAECYRYIQEEVLPSITVYICRGAWSGIKRVLPEPARENSIHIWCLVAGAGVSFGKSIATLVCDARDVPNKREIASGRRV